MSSVSSFFAKRWLRLPLLAATIAATVATSPPPGWAVSDRTSHESVHLVPGETAEIDLDYSASHPPSIAVAIEKVAVREGKLRVEVIDSRPGCAASGTFVREGDAWRSTEGASGRRSSATLVFTNPCSSTEKQGTVTIRFVDEGDTVLDFEWFATASISGEESNAPPGASVRLRIVE